MSRRAGDLFEADGAEFETYRGLREIPPYDEDCGTEEAPEAVSRIREAVRNADAVFFAPPRSGRVEQAVSLDHRDPATTAHLIRREIGQAEHRRGHSSGPTAIVPGG